jgi:PLP dependent protein
VRVKEPGAIVRLAKSRCRTTLGAHQIVPDRGPKTRVEVARPAARSYDRRQPLDPMPLPSSERALKANLERLDRRLDAARIRGRHSASAVRRVVVTKSAPADGLALLAQVGVADVGENRVQAAAQRRPSAPSGLVWHGIGHLQRNKAGKAVELFDVFHALDSEGLAAHLETALAKRGRTWPVYLEVNAAGDPDKGGIAPEGALAFLAAVSGHAHLDVVGWMTMGALGADPRLAFRALREIRDESVRRGVGRTPAAGLSMGMSDDFEVAVEEGATVVRVGRAVWEGVSAAPDAPPLARSA